MTKKLKATAKEYELVVNELAQRVNDIWSLELGRIKVTESLSRDLVDELLNSPSGDKLTFNSKVEMMAGDIQQIIMRHRRTNETADKQTS